MGVGIVLLLVLVAALLLLLAGHNPVQAALGEDPAGEKAQGLAERWSELIARFTGGDPGIEQNLSKLYADKANWPSTFKKPYSDEVGTFIHKAMALHKQGQ